MIYFTADTHFTHKNIIKFCDRPFSNVTQMNNVLIKEWNRTVTDDDIIYHLGDFGWKDNKENLSILRQLNGKKYLIKGNHDYSFIKDKAIRKEFVWIKDYYELIIDGMLIVLCHYPFATWRASHHGTWNLYGLSHGKYNSVDNQLDVGIDVDGFKPVSIDQVKDILNK